MTGTARLERHLNEAELDGAIDVAQRNGEARLVRRLLFVKNCYRGDALGEAGDRVGVSSATASRWARAWNEDGVDGLQPSFGGGRPPRLTEDQRERLSTVLEEWPLTTAEVAALVEAAFDVSYTRRHVRRLVDDLQADGNGPAAESRGSPADAGTDRGDRFDAALDALVGDE